VSLGQRACDRLLAPGRLPLAGLLAASPTLVVFPNKDVAIRQVRLLGKVASEPSPRARALATAAGAFGHERLDVQEAALDLIGKLGVPDGAEAAVIAGHAAHLAPVLAGKAAGLGLLAALPAPAAAPAAIPIAPAPPPDTLPPPLDDPAELVRLLTQLMEDEADALTVERALAGAVRLAALPASDRGHLGAPLVKRAEEFLSGLAHGGHALSQLIAHLALSWARPPCTPTISAIEATRILNSRIREACHVIQNGPAGAELLAEPSAADGSVHPESLLARLATWRGGLLVRYDMEIAMLRLPPVDAPFWAAWETAHPASAKAARQAYQAGTAELAFEPAFDTITEWRQSRTRVLARITSEPPAAAGASRCWGCSPSCEVPVAMTSSRKTQRSASASRPRWWRPGRWRVPGSPSSARHTCSRRYHRAWRRIRAARPRPPRRPRP
jgi:hypothetical protein